MKSLFASVLVFAFCISEGRGIKCYRCDSEVSWDDCVPGSNTECAAGLDSCVKFEGQAEFRGVTHKYFYKGCASKSRCTDEICKLLVPPSATIKKCDVSCCQGDLCNGAKVSSTMTNSVSGFLFLACALVAFFS